MNLWKATQLFIFIHLNLGSAVSTTPYITIYLLLLIALGYVVTDIYLPSLPALSAYFHASDREVQITLSSYLLSFSLAPLIFGPLSDKFGRKKVILYGLFISIAATLSCLVAQTIQQFSAFRFLQGVGTGAVMIASRTTASDLFSGTALAKQMSLMTMLMPFVLAIAPVIGGILQQQLHWQSVFLFLASYMLVVTIWAALKPETLKNPSNKNLYKIFSSYRIHLRNRLFLVFAINFALPTLGVFAYLSISPFLFQTVLGLSPTQYGILALYAGGTIILTGYINLKLLHYISVTQIICTGIGMMILAGCLLLYFHLLGILTPWSLLLPALIYLTSVPLCVANTAAKAMNLVEDHFGAATALLTSFQFLIASCGSFIASIAYETTLPLALCFIGVGLLSLINLGFGCRLEKNAEMINTKRNNLT